MNTCEEKASRPSRTRKTRSAERSSVELSPCFVVGTDCWGPSAPAVSSDCGINSAIVRAWASRPPGSGAPWATRSTLTVVGCCDCEDDCC